MSVPFCAGLAPPDDKNHLLGSYDRFGYVDFLTLPVAEGIINKSSRTAGVMDIAHWLNTSKGEQQHFPAEKEEHPCLC